MHTTQQVLKSELCVTKCVPAEHYVADKLEEFIQVVNSKLEALNMQIRTRASEDDGMTCYALVSI